MKAWVLTDTENKLQLRELVNPEPSAGEALVRIQFSGLNRRDQWMLIGKYPGIVANTILGSDGCGVVEVGPDEWKSKEVVINPNIRWGGMEAAQSSDYSILGMPVNGTLANYVKVPLDRLHRKPDHLTPAEAAALPLAGLTAYRATLVKGKAGEGKKILVTGIGGGVALMALLFALAVGAQVWVTSSSQDKIDRACELGAKGGYLYTDPEWFRKVGPRGFDLVIDSGGGPQLNNYLRVIAPAGKIVIYGSTAGYPDKLDVFRLFWSQATIEGSTMGSDKEFKDMLAFVSRHHLKPVIDREYPSALGLEAFQRFLHPSHFGKIVIDWTL